MIKINLLTILFFGLLLQTVHCQNAPITIAPAVTCLPGSPVDIPITVMDFDSIGAISLTLLFDPDVLDYQSFTNNSNFPGLLIYEQLPGKIAAGGLNFYGNAGVSLNDNAILFTLHFNGLGGATALEWYDDGGSCEYADAQYNPLNDYPTCSYFYNGTVNYTTINLELKAYLEGAFANGEMTQELSDLNLVPVFHPYTEAPWNMGCPEQVDPMPENVVDWVFIEIRKSNEGPALATADKKIAQEVGLLMTNGFIKKADGLHDLQFSVPGVSNLYVVIHHRNHLSVIASNPVAVLNGQGTYDFTISDQGVYGGASALKQISDSMWAMIAGDSNADGNIDGFDKENGLNPLMGQQGYLSADFSFDSQVNNQDKNNFWTINMGYYSYVP